MYTVCNLSVLQNIPFDTIFFNDRKVRTSKFMFQLIFTSLKKTL